MVLSQATLRIYWAPRCRGPWATVSLYGNGRVTVDAAIVPAVKALNKILESYKYVTRYADTGAYNCRINTSGTAWSLHAYAIALDINWQSNPYSRYLRTNMFQYGDHRMPYRICDIRTNNGKQVWNWGGFWSGNKDAMHYEIVCTPADLRTGINPATVRGSGGSSSPAPIPKPPVVVTGDDNLVMRIYWFKNGTGPTAAYRCILGKLEKKSPAQYGIWAAYWIPDAADLSIFRGRGLLEANTPSTAIATRPSIEIHNGPYDNTKTF